MAKRWYPVIDYSACIACGACVRKCSHGVYNAGKAPTPVVVNPGVAGDLRGGGAEVGAQRLDVRDPSAVWSTTQMTLAAPLLE